MVIQNKLSRFIQIEHDTKIEQNTIQNHAFGPIFYQQQQQYWLQTFHAWL